MSDVKTFGVIFSDDGVRFTLSASTKEYLCMNTQRCFWYYLPDLGAL